MLIGLGRMYGAAMTLGGGSPDTLASPVSPDVVACTVTDAMWDGSSGDRCFLPAIDPEQLDEFKFENYPHPVSRVRHPAHLAMQDPEWLEDYKKAIAIMKSLPLSDPRSFMQQARVHCAYCDGAYPMLGHPDERLLVHASWLFASFHRWYLFFFERIMGKNWDHPDGMRILDMFKDINSPLYDPNRNVKHLDKIIDLSYHVPKDNPDFEHNNPDDRQIQENLLLMRKQMLYSTKPQLFFGAAYRAEDKADPNSGAGALELAPHNAIHLWTGSSSPGHGCLLVCRTGLNLLLLWNVWRNDLPGRSRTDLTDPDYLNASFILFHENAKPVRVLVKDSFNTEKLGYKYEQQDLPWLFKKISRPTKPTITETTVSFPKKLDSVITTKVVRPQKECLKDFIKFDVFVNDDHDHQPDEKTEVKPQYAGSFTSLTHKSSGGPVAKIVDGVMGSIKPRKNALWLALSNLLEDIGASDDEAIQVTVVPRSGTESVVITNVSIQFVA
ncbi:Polyphenol oxidase chloroplastic [Bienertia sinuspersici]